MTPTEEHDALSRILANAVGWEQTPGMLTTIHGRVGGLGPHAIHQALPLAQANPGPDLTKAAVSFIVKDYTDGISFLGVNAWTYQDLTKSVRLLGQNKRYKYRDLLQAPARILSEARTLVAITDLCLSGAVTNGSSHVIPVREGWALINADIQQLVIDYPGETDDLLHVIKELDTLNVDSIRSRLDSPVAV